MQVVNLNIKSLNEKLKEKGYRGWSFEFDSSEERYCLSIFDSYNPEDELIFFLNAFEPNVISKSVRFKKDDIANPVDKKHFYYVTAEKIIKEIVTPLVG